MAPKIVSEHERALTRQTIMKQTRKLIAIKQGIRNITVDDITQAVGIAKGSFYSYFASKEACLYDVIEQAYETDLMHLEAIMTENIVFETKMEKFVMNIFLGADGIGRYITSQDYEILLRRLPNEYMKRGEYLTETTVSGMMEIFSLARPQVESILVMLDCINNVATQTALTDEIKEETIKTLTKAIANYIKEYSEHLEVRISQFTTFPIQDLLWLGGY